MVLTTLLHAEQIVVKHGALALGLGQRPGSMDRAPEEVDWRMLGLPVPSVRVAAALLCPLQAEGDLEDHCHEELVEE